MTTEEAGGCLAVLVVAFPNAKVDGDLATLYVAAFVAMDAQVGRRAVVRCLALGRFFPTLAELQASALRSADVTGLPGPASAWESVVGKHKDLPLPVRRAAEFVGGPWAIRTAENPVALRAQFMRAYEEFREEAVEQVILGDVDAAVARLFPSGLREIDP